MGFPHAAAKGLTESGSGDPGRTISRGLLPKQGTRKSCPDTHSGPEPSVLSCSHDNRDSHNWNRLFGEGRWGRIARLRERPIIGD